jgi:hypothetical protein
MSRNFRTFSSVWILRIRTGGILWNSLGREDGCVIGYDVSSDCSGSSDTATGGLSQWHCSPHILYPS